MALIAKRYGRLLTILPALVVGSIVFGLIPCAASPLAPAQHASMTPHRSGDGGWARGARHQGQSDNWGGYVVSNYQTGLLYNAIQSTWVVPTVTTSLAGNAQTWQYSSSWIGIGGSCEDAHCVNSDSTLIQLGTEQDVYSTGATQYYAWYEVLPSNSVTIPNAISPGDSISASIQCTASCTGGTQTWLLTISDATAGWTWSKTVSYASSLLSADWIEEATSTCGRHNACSIAPLAHFNPISFTGATVNGSNPNFDLPSEGVQLTDSYGQTANSSAPQGGNAFSVCWGVTTFTPCVYDGAADHLFSAVVPSSRSVQVGATATAFATIINAGSVAASACQISLGSNIAANFSYQTTDPATNAFTGTANTAVDIPAGAAQTFEIAVSTGSTLAPSNVAFQFLCANANAAPIYTGINTLLLSSSNTPTADMVAEAGTQSGDGVVRIPNNTHQSAFVVATSNVGSAATITAKINTGTATLPLNLTICQTLSTGACMASPASTVQVDVAANATPTFAVFATATGAIPFLPAANRIFVSFYDTSNVERGAASVAVTTQ